MSFYECFTDTFSMMPSQQSLDYLTELKSNAPAEYLDNLLQIIDNPEIPLKIRINAANCLTVPIRKAEASYTNVLRFEERNELVSSIFPLVFKYIFIPDDLGMTLIKSFVECLNSVGLSLKFETIIHIFENFNENTPSEAINRILTCLLEIDSEHYGNIPPRTLEVIVEAVNRMGVRDDILLNLMKIISNYSEIFIYESSAGLVSLYLPFIEQYYDVFPYECAKIVSNIPQKYIENFIDKMLNLIYSSPKNYPYISCINKKEILEQIDVHQLVQYALVVYPQVADLYKDGDDFLLTPPNVLQFLIDNYILNDKLNGVEFMNNFVIENIENEDESIRYSALVCCLSLIQQTDVVPLPIDHILSTFMENQNPLIMSLCLKIVRNALSYGSVEVSQNILEFALHFYNCEDKSVTKNVEEIIETIITKNNPEINMNIWEFMYSNFEANNEDVEEGQKALQLLSLASSKIPVEAAAELIDKFIETIMQDLENIYTSKLVGILGNLIKCAKQMIGNIYEVIIQISSSLYESSHESDAIYLLTVIAECVGNEPEERIQAFQEFCVDVFQKLVDNIANIDEMEIFAHFTCAFIEYVTNPQALEFIFERMLLIYLQPLDINENISADIMEVFYVIYQTLPDLVRPHLREIVDTKWWPIDSQFLTGVKFNMNFIADAAICQTERFEFKINPLEVDTMKTNLMNKIQYSEGKDVSSDINLFLSTLSQVQSICGENYMPTLIYKWDVEKLAPILSDEQKVAFQNLTTYNEAMLQDSQSNQENFLL